MTSDQTSIENFINYNYIPYSRRQCVKRTIWLLISCAVCGNVGGLSYAWICVGALIFFAAVAVLINNGRKNKGAMQQRFIADGVFYLAISLTLNLLSYRTYTVSKGENLLLLLVLLGILAASMTAMLSVIHRNIEKDNYSKKNAVGTSAGSMIFSALGVLLAPFILAGQSQDTYIMIIASILLFLSVLIGVGALNLLKLRYINSK